MYNKKEYMKKWRIENKEHRKEYQIRWSGNNSGYMKQWRKENPEIIKKYKTIKN